jgi:mannose-6-phosphate isomerase-like protein (cupin superfamily)
MVYIYQSKWQAECDLNHPPERFSRHSGCGLRWICGVATHARRKRLKRDRSHCQMLYLAWRKLMSAAPVINNHERGDRERDRRWFLLRASAASAAGLSIACETFNTLGAAAQSAPTPPSGGVQSFTAAGLQNAVANIQANPGTNTLVDEITFTVALTVEKNKVPKEFEWHEGRDHIFQILDGSTVIEVGGTPKNAHSTKPGEWLAPDSENAVKLTLNKGDMLVIARGVPHRRTTAGSVTFMLISPQGTV